MSQWKLLFKREAEVPFGQNKVQIHDTYSVIVLGLCFLRGVFFFFFGEEDKWANLCGVGLRNSQKRKQHLRGEVPCGICRAKQSKYRPNYSTKMFWSVLFGMCVSSKQSVTRVCFVSLCSTSSCSCEIKVDTKKEAAPGRHAVETAGEAEGVTWSSVLGDVDGALVLFVG